MKIYNSFTLKSKKNFQRKEFSNEKPCVSLHWFAFRHGCIVWEKSEICVNFKSFELELNQFKIFDVCIGPTGCLTFISWYTQQNFSMLYVILIWKTPLRQNWVSKLNIHPANQKISRFDDENTRQIRTQLIDKLFSNTRAVQQKQFYNFFKTAYQALAKRPAHTCPF